MRAQIARPARAGRGGPPRESLDHAHFCCWSPRCRPPTPCTRACRCRASCRGDSCRPSLRPSLGAASSGEGSADTWEAQGFVSRCAAFKHLAAGLVFSIVPPPRASATASLLHHKNPPARRVQGGRGGRRGGRGARDRGHVRQGRRRQDHDDRQPGHVDRAVGGNAARRAAARTVGAAAHRACSAPDASTFLARVCSMLAGLHHSAQAQTC